MYAIDFLRKLVFIYAPEAGLAIPLVMDTVAQALDVTYPSVDDIEENFEVFVTFQSMLAAFPEFEDAMRRLEKLDREASVALADLIEDDSTTNEQLERGLEQFINESQMPAVSSASAAAELGEGDTANGDATGWSYADALKAETS